MLSLAHAGVRRGTGPQRPTKAAPSPQQPMSTSLVDSATSCLRAPTPLPGCTRHPCRTVLPKSGGNWYPYAGLATLQTAPQWPNCSSTFTASAPSLSSRLPRQWGHQARPALLCLLSTTLHAKGKGCPAPLSAMESKPWRLPLSTLLQCCLTWLLIRCLRPAALHPKCLLLSARHHLQPHHKVHP